MALGAANSPSLPSVTLKSLPSTSSPKVTVVGVFSSPDTVTVIFFTLYWPPPGWVNVTELVLPVHVWLPKS